MASRKPRQEILSLKKENNSSHLKVKGKKELKTFDESEAGSQNFCDKKKKLLVRINSPKVARKRKAKDEELSRKNKDENCSKETKYARRKKKPHNSIETNSSKCAPSSSSVKLSESSSPSSKPDSCCSEKVSPSVYAPGLPNTLSNAKNSNGKETGLTLGTDKLNGSSLDLKSLPCSLPLPKKFISVISNSSNIDIKEKDKHRSYHSTFSPVDVLPEIEINVNVDLSNSSNSEKILHTVDPYTNCIFDSDIDENVITGDHLVYCTKNDDYNLVNSKQSCELMTLLVDRINASKTSKERIICDQLKIDPLIKPKDFNYDQTNLFNFAVDISMLKAADDYVKEYVSKFHENPGMTFEDSFESSWQNSILKTADLSSNLVDLGTNGFNQIYSDDTESEISISSCNTADIQPDFFDVPGLESPEKLMGNIPNNLQDNSDENLKPTVDNLMKDEDFKIESSKIFNEQSLFCENDNILSKLNPEGPNKLPARVKGKRKKMNWSRKKRKCNKRNPPMPTMNGIVIDEILCDTCDESEENELDLTKVSSDSHIENYLLNVCPNPEIFENMTFVDLSCDPKTTSNNSSIDRNKSLKSLGNNNSSCNDQNVNSHDLSSENLDEFPLKGSADDIIETNKQNTEIKRIKIGGTTKQKTKGVNKYRDSVGNNLSKCENMLNQSKSGDQCQNNIDNLTTNNENNLHFDSVKFQNLTIDKEQFTTFFTPVVKLQHLDAITLYKYDKTFAVRETSDKSKSLSTDEVINHVLHDACDSEPQFSNNLKSSNFDIPSGSSADSCNFNEKMDMNEETSLVSVTKSESKDNENPEQCKQSKSGSRTKIPLSKKVVNTVAELNTNTLKSKSRGKNKSEILQLNSSSETVLSENSSNVSCKQKKNSSDSIVPDCNLSEHTEKNLITVDSSTSKIISLKKPNISHQNSDKSSKDGGISSQEVVMCKESFDVLSKREQLMASSISKEEQSYQSEDLGPNKELKTAKSYRSKGKSFENELNKDSIELTHPSVSKKKCNGVSVSNKLPPKNIKNAKSTKRKLALSIKESDNISLEKALQSSEMTSQSTASCNESLEVSLEQNQLSTSESNLNINFKDFVTNEPSKKNLNPVSLYKSELPANNSTAVLLDSEQLVETLNSKNDEDLVYEILEPDNNSENNLLNVELPENKCTISEDKINAVPEQSSFESDKLADVKIHHSQKSKNSIRKSNDEKPMASSSETRSDNKVQKPRKKETKISNCKERESTKKSKVKKQISLKNSKNQLKSVRASSKNCNKKNVLQEPSYVVNEILPFHSSQDLNNEIIYNQTTLVMHSSSELLIEEKTKQSDSCLNQNEGLLPLSSPQEKCEIDKNAHIQIPSIEVFETDKKNISSGEDTAETMDQGKIQLTQSNLYDELDFEPDQFDDSFLNLPVNISTIDSVGTENNDEIPLSNQECIPSKSCQSPESDATHSESSFAFKDNDIYYNDDLGSLYQTEKDTNTAQPPAYSISSHNAELGSLYQIGKDTNTDHPPTYSISSNNFLVTPNKNWLSEDDSDSESEHDFKRARYNKRRNSDVEEPSNNYCGIKNCQSLDGNFMAQYQEQCEIEVKSPSEMGNASTSSFTGSLKSDSVQSFCEDQDKNGSKSSQGNNFKPSTSNGSHLKEVLTQIKELCSKQHFDKAIETAKTYFGISSNDINKCILHVLLISIFSVIFKSGVNELIFKILDDVLNLIQDFDLCNKKIASCFISKCCSYPDQSVHAIKLLQLCQKKKVPLNSEALDAFSSLLKSHEISLPALVDFLNYVKKVCNKKIPRELMHLVLKKCDTCSFPDFHNVCTLLHDIRPKEIEETDLKEFILLCFKKGLWQHLAEMFIVWGYRNSLSLSIYTALASDYKTVGKCFRKFANYLHEKEGSLSSEMKERFNSDLKTRFGLMGTALMLNAFSKSEMTAALEILYVLHTYNVNYVALQTTLENLPSSQSLAETNNCDNKVFPFTIIFTAIDICLNLNRPKDAFTIFQDFSWATPSESSDEKLRTHTSKESCIRLLKLVPLLNNENSLDEGWEALERLLTLIKEDSVFEIVQKNIKALVSIYNEYLISLLNTDAVSLAYVLYQHSLGPRKDIFTITPDVLRGLVVSFHEDGRDEAANSLFLLGILMNVYPIQKPNLETFPWEITLLTHWTTTEIKVAVEWYIGVLFPLLMEKPKETHFENWFSVKIVFKILKASTSSINCLNELESGSYYYITKTKNALGSMSPSLKVTEVENENALCIDCNSLYNFWKHKCPDAAMKFISMDLQFVKLQADNFSFGGNENYSQERESSVFVKNFFGETNTLLKSPENDRESPVSEESWPSTSSLNPTKDITVDAVYEMINESRASNSSKLNFIPKTPEQSPSGQNSVLTHTVSPNDNLKMNDKSVSKAYQSPDKTKALNSSAVKTDAKHLPLFSVPNKYSALGSTFSYSKSNISPKTLSTSLDIEKSNNQSMNFEQMKSVDNISSLGKPSNNVASPSLHEKAVGVILDSLPGLGITMSKTGRRKLRGLLRSNLNNQETFPIKQIPVNKKTKLKPKKKLKKLSTSKIMTPQKTTLKPSTASKLKLTKNINSTPACTPKLVATKKIKLEFNNKNTEFQNFQVCVTPSDRTVNNLSSSCLSLSPRNTENNMKINKIMMGKTENVLSSRSVLNQGRFTKPSIMQSKKEMTVTDFGNLEEPSTSFQNETYLSNFSSYQSLPAITKSIKRTEINNDVSIDHLKRELSSSPSQQSKITTNCPKFSPRFSNQTEKWNQLGSTSQTTLIKTSMQSDTKNKVALTKTFNIVKLKTDSGSDSKIENKSSKFSSGNELIELKPSKPVIKRNYNISNKTLFRQALDSKSITVKSSNPGMKQICNSDRNAENASSTSVRDQETSYKNVTFSLDSSSCRTSFKRNCEIFGEDIKIVKRLKESEETSETALGNSNCSPEEFNKIIHFINVKVRQKHNNLSPQEQNKKAFTLAQAFITENKDFTSKKTMKLLYDYVASNV